MVVDEQIPNDQQLSGELTGDHELARGKRSKIAPDRLTELPDLALAHILSHLYVEEAAKTIVLSKRFNSVWNSVSTLNFSDENYRKYGNSFIKFVDSSLGFHNGKKIEKFSVKFRIMAFIGVDWDLHESLDDCGALRWIDSFIRR
ncbi:hypothetical protein BVRB_8g181500 isoform A [Beta vulgaris subsp. vulgaris]|nr:hypothetical protein BVRB_8g181500 isoform A [Beta vulgaris subsp. vulgaris]